jgi:hypothetical protein
MKLHMHKRMASLVAATLIATIAAVGIVKAAGRKPAQRSLSVAYGSVYVPGAAPRAAPALPARVPWEFREPRRYEGLRVQSQDKSPLNKQIAAVLMGQEIAPPQARLAYYQWLFEPPQPGEQISHPLEDHQKVHIYGWDGSIVATEIIPGGWRATLNVVPRIEADWHHSPIVIDSFREEYVSQGGEITLMRSFRPDPQPGEWSRSVTTP